MRRFVLSRKNRRSLNGVEKSSATSCWAMDARVRFAIDCTKMVRRVDGVYESH